MTGIEWTDQVWNPTHGCDKVSAGCDNCYALTMAKRLKAMGQPGYQHDGDPRTSGPGFALTIEPDRLTLPLRWRKPRKVFVNSMSDLFHADVPNEHIAQVFAVMAAAQRHTFQLLTKRHARMRSLLSSEDFRTQVAEESTELLVTTGPYQNPALDINHPEWHAVSGGPDGNVWHPTWPLPNVWLGVSVEDQHWADIRIPALLDTLAAVRWISAEPLLGSVDLRPWLSPFTTDTPLDWIVTGGESGPGARPMHPEWARSLRDQCADHDVPFLFKQWGNWRPAAIGDRMYLTSRAGMLSEDGTWESGEHVDVCYPNESDGTAMVHVGKTAAGRELDGRTHDAYPDLEMTHA